MITKFVLSSTENKVVIFISFEVNKKVFHQEMTKNKHCLRSISLSCTDEKKSIADRYFPCILCSSTRNLIQ